MNAEARNERIYFHEAGHAVAAALLGVFVVSASAEHDGHSDGRVVIHRPAALIVNLVVSMAGPAAELVLYGGDGTVDRWLPWHEWDYEAIKGLIADDSGHRDPADAVIYHEAMLLCQSLVNRHWKTITIVARAIETRKTINGALVRQIVRHCHRDYHRRGKYEFL